MPPRTICRPTQNIGLRAQSSCYTHATLFLSQPLGKKVYKRNNADIKMPSRHSHRSATRSQPRGASDDRDNTGQSPEILRQLGRAVLSYSLKRLNQQRNTRSRQRDPSSRQRSSRSQNRDTSGARDGRGSSRDLSRGDSDMHNLLSQVAVGVFAFGVRHLIHRRREAKRQAQAAAQVNPRGGVTAGQVQRPGAIDPELSAALNTVARELQGASDSIRRLASSAPSHRNCAVRDALVADADRLHRSLANMQTSINNMRNLHPGLDKRRDLNRPERSRRQEKDGRRRRTEEEEVGSARRDRDQPRQPHQRRPSRRDDEGRNVQQP